MEAFGLVAIVSFFLFLNDNDFASHSADSGSNLATPALSMVPNSDKSETEVNLISYTRSSDASWQPLVDQLNDFLAVYDANLEVLLRSSSNAWITCGFGRQKEKENVCIPDMKLLNGCYREINYGYNEGEPCVFIHLEKILNWVPVAYNKSGLPSDMPQDLQKTVKEFSFDGQMIWLSCDGEDAADRENIGALTISPDHGFPNYYFPFTDIPGYMSPLVAVKFKRPKLHVPIKIECRVWAKNIEYNRSEHRGSVRFQLRVD